MHPTAHQPPPAHDGVVRHRLPVVQELVRAARKTSAFPQDGPSPALFPIRRAEAAHPRPHPALQEQIRGLDEFLEEEKEIERRRKEAYERKVKTDAVKEALNELTRSYLDLLSSEDAQARGYRLEKILYGLFELFDLDPKASFKVIGEQIDGAFTFENIDYLLEAKWQKEPVRASALDSLL